MMAKKNDTRSSVRRKVILYRVKSLLNGPLGFILSVAISTMILYLIYVKYVPRSDAKLIISILFSALNVIALLLSFTYFYSTQKSDDEMNIIIQREYRRYGITVVHLLLLIGRMVINVVMIMLLYNPNVNLYEGSYIGSSIFYPYIFIYSIITAIWLSEALQNARNNCAVLRNFIMNPERSMNEDIDFSKNESCLKYDRFCEEPKIIEIAKIADGIDDSIGNIIFPDAQNSGDEIYFGSKDNPVSISDLYREFESRSSKVKANDRSVVFSKRNGW